MERVIATASEAKIDYIEIVRVSDLQPIEKLDGLVLIALAVYFGKARLIDNIILDVSGHAVREILPSLKISRSLPSQRSLSRPWRYTQ
jgi:hypothetical protein